MNEATSWLFILIIVIVGFIALAQGSGMNLLQGGEETPHQEATTTEE